jgi:ankyrin repeat protein
MLCCFGWWVQDDPLFCNMTPLLYACINGHLNVVTFLVAEGADMNFTCFVSTTKNMLSVDSVEATAATAAAASVAGGVVDACKKKWR